MSSKDILRFPSNHTPFKKDVAISKRNSCKIKYFSPIQFKDKNGNTPLHRAVINPNCTVDRIKIYLHTSFLNDRNFLWHTPLHCIIMSNCHKIDVIELMINKGANVYAKDRNGSTVLHKAIENPNCTTELIELLIKNFPLLSVMQCMSETPLMLAVRNRNHNLKIIEKLFYKGCIDVCMQHTENHNTLRILCNDLVLMKVFLRYSTYVGPGRYEYAEVEDIIDFSCPKAICGFSSIKGKNIRNTDLATSLLMFAVKYPSYNMDVIKELLQKGAEIFATNCKNRCAFEYALKNPACSPELVQELLKHDKTKVKWLFVVHKDISFLHMAASNRSCPAEVMKVLVKWDRGETLNMEDVHYLTPLDCAADCTQGTSCNLDVVETLLLRRALTCQANTLDMTVLWKNIQVLGSPDANLDVLNCTKLLVKYALVEKGDAGTVYTGITKMCARFRWRDKLGYFAELASYLNQCYTEIMNMRMIKVGPMSFLEFILFIRSPKSQYEHISKYSHYISIIVNMVIYQNPQQGKRTLLDSLLVEDFDISGFGQEVFELMVSNKFPLYRRLVITSLKKKIFEHNVFDLLMYTACENGNRIYLNSYCIQHLALYLENEDLFNLYLAFTDHSDTNSSSIGPESTEASCDSDDNICYSYVLPPPRKKCKLH